MKRTICALGLATMLAGVLPSPASAAFVALPATGAQVNDDPASMIDPSQDAGLVDVAGGTVVAGNKAVPWATFEQKLGRSQQIFVRAFKNGQWVTQGSPASLNIDPTVEAEAPSIDFAGAGRTVPWGRWHEPNRNFGAQGGVGGAASHRRRRGGGGGGGRAGAPPWGPPPPPTTFGGSRFSAGANR